MSLQYEQTFYGNGDEEEEYEEDPVQDEEQ